jgi:hypothetical protein
MKVEIAREIVEAAESEGWESSLREDYSGRGMYGRTTAGVIMPDLLKFAAAVGMAVHLSDNPERIILAVADASQDSMGLDVIVY